MLKSTLAIGPASRLILKLTIASGRCRARFCIECVHSIFDPSLGVALLIKLNSTASEGLTPKVTLTAARQPIGTRYKQVEVVIT